MVGRAMIRGEPAIGREQSREPRLYSVEPTWGLDHEAVIRFCGQGSEAAGPFSQRHCSHSRIRIAATSDRHRLVWGFLCQGCITPFLSRVVTPFFCSTRAASILPSRPHIAVAVARSGGQGRRFFSAAEGLSLTDASTAAGCP